MNALKTIINEHVTWRGQIIKLAKGDIRKTYSGAALGWSWAVVKPTVTILVFWFAIIVGFRSGKPVNDYPYILWLTAGFIPWFYMSEMITDGAGSIRKYKYLVTKMKYPVSTIPTFVGIAKLVIHCVLMCLVVIMFMLFGYMPDIYYLEVFYYMFCMVAFFIAWGLFSAMLSAMSKDFLNLVKSVVQAIFWMSGIVYNMKTVDSDLVRHIMYFNPVSYVASGYRDAFVYKEWFWEHPTQMACYFFTLFVMVVLAVWAYKKLIREIPDVL